MSNSRYTTLGFHWSRVNVIQNLAMAVIDTLKPKGTGERFTSRNQYEEGIREKLGLTSLPLEGVRQSLREHTAFTVAAYKEMRIHEFLETVEWQHRLLVGYGCDWLEGELLRLALQTTQTTGDGRIAVKLTGAGAGGSLELLHTVDTVIFDKTGTLTLEQPQVVCVHRCGDLDTDTLLTYAAAAESRQTHPIARAILEAAAERGLTPPAFDQARYDVGYGIRVQIGDRLVRVGSDRYMAQEEIDVPDAIRAIKEACHAEGHSLVMMAVDDRLAGAIELSPTLRPEARKVIAELRRRDLRLVIISGDQEQPTRKMAQELGIDRYFANTLPENKAALVEQMQREGRTVCFVGDGINDAIALKTANVSISLRGATTAATDTAQIVLMAQNLRQLPYLFDLGDDFDATLRACFAAAVVPGLLIIGGAYLNLLGIAGSLLILAVSMLTGLGIAVLPRYSRKQ